MLLFPNRVPWRIRVNKKHWNTRKGHTGCVATRKMVFPMVDWKTTDFALWNFEILRCAAGMFSFEIQNSPSKIQKKKIIEITMMITRCGPMVNDKRQPIPTTPIDTLFKIVRGRGLVRRSSANDHFLLLICSFCTLLAVYFEYFVLPLIFNGTVNDQKRH